MNIGKWTILLAAFWILLSGYFQPLLLSFGVISTLIVVYVLHRMNKMDNQPKSLGTGYRSLYYFAWLIGQIVQSSIHVTKLIWGAPKNVNPSLEKVSMKNLPKDKQVLYANSITLTPGTLSVDLNEEEVTVHALQKKSINQLKKGSMESKITSLWSKQK